MEEKKSSTNKQDFDSQDKEDNNGEQEETVMVLWCLIRDSIRTGGHSSKLKDEIIAQTAYQFESENLLFHNSAMRLTLSLFPPRKRCILSSPL